MSKSFSTNKLKIDNKSTICAITLILVLAASSLAILLPIVGADNTGATGPTGNGITVPEWAYINAFPSPVGVGQTISIFAWTANYPPTANGNYGDRWTNLTIIVTKPDGTTTTLGPYVSDPVGTIFDSYVPQETGNYTFQFVVPGQLLNNQPNGVNPTELAEAQGFATANKLPLSVGEGIFVTGFTQLGDYYTPATSDPVTVNVQSTAIAGAPAYPLPTEYWSTPVSQSGHENWGYITGDWLANGELNSNIDDFTTPPTTAHIAWTKPINFGGIGGQPQAINSGGDNYYSYLSYESMYNPPIIMNGMLYYNTPNPPEYGFTCVDLATGQTVWYQNGTNCYANAAASGLGNNGVPYSAVQIGFGFAKQNFPQLSFGQELDYESPNQHGLIDYLWCTWSAPNGSAVWSMFDPMTGNWICNLWNVPPTAAVFGASSLITDSTGTLLSYNLNLASSASGKSTMTVWNSTEAIQNTNPSMEQTNGYWMWRPPLGGQIDASTAVTTYPMTGTLPAGAYSLTFSSLAGMYLPAATLIYMDKADQVAIYSTASATLGVAGYPTPNSFTQFGISINPTNVGTILWGQTYPWPSGNITMEGGFCNNGVFTLFQKETRLWMGFSATNGNLLYTTTTPEVSNHVYGITGGIYNDVLYSGDSIGEGGTMYAYNATTGALLYSTIPTTMGYNGYWDDIPMSVGTFAAGNIYWYGEEHSPGPNLEPGFMIGDVNATTGAPVWNITFWNAGEGFGGMAMADGYMALLNAYDNQIYSFGMGPTSTSVSTSWSNLGKSVVLQGSVLDISSGTKQDTIAKQFPQGVAAVSDASMTAYMEYVYMQNPIPTNTTGVPVQVTLIDPNGNAINLPAVTSDMDGHYSIDYTVPNVPGTYTAIATFHGTDAYWPSYSETTFQVDPTATATPAPTATPTSVADMYFVPAIAGLFVLIIVGLIVLALLVLRKKA